MSTPPRRSGRSRKKRNYADMDGPDEFSDADLHRIRERELRTNVDGHVVDVEMTEDHREGNIGRMVNYWDECYVIWDEWI